MISFKRRYFEADAQYCAAEFGLGLWVTVLDGNHLTAALHLGWFDFSIDLYLPIGEAA